MRKLTVRFADSEYEGLSQYSVVVERSLNEIVREAVREYIKNQASPQH